MEFGKMLRELRRKAGLSQSELAQRAKLPLRSIQNWEIEHRVPKASALLALADALGADVGELLRATAPKKKRK